MRAAAHGHAKWSVALAAMEAQRRGIAKKVGRETIRRMLADHELKPWRENMWCVPALDDEYVAKMEDVLNLLARPYDEREPVVALDERPVQLLDSARPDLPGDPARVARRDYEYVRCGTANVYGIVEPKAGRHLTHATKNRKRAQFAAAMQRIAAAYPTATTIHIIMDNLNIHRENVLKQIFGDEVGAALGRASRRTTRRSTRAG